MKSIERSPVEVSRILLIFNTGFSKPLKSVLCVLSISVELSMEAFLISFEVELSTYALSSIGILKDSVLCPSNSLMRMKSRVISSWSEQKLETKSCNLELARTIIPSFL